MNSGMSSVVFILRSPNYHYQQNQMQILAKQQEMFCSKFSIMDSEFSLLQCPIFQRNYGRDSPSQEVNYLLKVFALLISLETLNLKLKRESLKSLKQSTQCSLKSDNLEMDLVFQQKNGQHSLSIHQMMTIRLFFNKIKDTSINFVELEQSPS